MNEALAPVQITPVLPESEKRRLSELPLQIHETLGELRAAVAPALHARVAALMRGLNAHYSNLIEGQPTFPHDIEAAEAALPVASEAEARRRRVGVAHSEVEQWMRARLAAEPDLSIWTTDFVCQLHHELYRRLDAEDAWIHDLNGVAVRPLLIGRLRESNVRVSRHIAPRHEDVPRLMDQLFSICRSEAILPHRQLVVAAAAHQRLALIHPFGDGNGRIMRLHTQAALIRAGLDADGMWSMSRGLARAKARYYEHLAAADQERRGDTDGRGPLSDAALARFCVFFLETALDQIGFLAKVFDFRNLAPRVERHAREANVFAKAHVERGCVLLRELVIRGQLTRSEAAAVLDRGESTTRQIIQAAVSVGLIEAKNQKAPLELKFSTSLYEAYFPRLYDGGLL